MQSQNKKEKRIVKEFRESREEVYEEPVEIRRTGEVRTQNVTVFVAKKKIHRPLQVESMRTTNYNLIKDLNRHATANAVAKNQIYGQVSQMNLNLIKQNQQRRIGKVYHYGIVSRKDFVQRPSKRTYQQRSAMRRSKEVYSVDSPRQTRVYYRPLEIEGQYYPNRVYVSGSPIRRRINRNEFDSYYHATRRGGIVKLRKLKYTSQTEINKIILIQRWWRYILDMLEARGYRKSRGSERIGVEDSVNIRDYMAENESREEINRRMFRNTRQNVTEKIIPGRSNKFIVETTKIEVFKNENVFLKKVNPEELTKESKKIKRIKFKEEAASLNIKEEIIKLWLRECQQISETSVDILAAQKEKIITVKTEILEEYEYQLKKLKLLLAKKEEEITKLTESLKSQVIIKKFENLNLDSVSSLNLLTEKLSWNDSIIPKKTNKISFKGEKKNN